MTILTDDDLTRLLGELAESYDVPEHGQDEVLAALDEPAGVVPLRRRRWVQLAAAAAVLALGMLVGLAALDRPTAGRMQTASAPAATYGKNDAATRTPLAPGLTGGSTAPGGAWTSGSWTAVNQPPVPTDARVVKTGTIALVAKDGRVSATLAAVADAGKAEGGYVSDSKTDEYSQTPSGSVTLRVPVDQFEALVARVRALGAKVRTASITGRDVTAQYTDLQAQLTSLRAARDRFAVILARANTVSEILAVQQRIDTVNGQIDQIEGRRKLLAAQSDESTLTVSVSEAGDPVVRVSQHRSGMVQAFVDAKNGFVTGVEGLIRHSGRALLVLMCVAVLLLVARGGWRVARRRMV